MKSITVADLVEALALGHVSTRPAPEFDRVVCTEADFPRLQKELPPLRISGQEVGGIIVHVVPSPGFARHVAQKLQEEGKRVAILELSE